MAASIDNTASAPAAPEPTPEIDTDSLTRAAGRGAAWRIGGGFWQTIVRLGASTVLARALTKDDFGIVGLAILTRGLIQTFGALGMGTGLIAKQEVTEDDLCTAFWTTAAVRVFLFAGAMVGAPFVAAFFRAPELTWVLRVVCISFLFGAASSVPATLMQKRLQFGPTTIIQGVGVVVESAAAIVLVKTTNLHYWALVLAMVITGVVTHTATILYVRWRPRFRFDRASFRFLFRYGIHGLGFSAVNYLNQNIDYLLVGRLLGKGVLGLYEFAYRIPHLVYERLARRVGGVVFPALSKVQSSDERLVAGYVKVVRHIAFLVFPMLAGLAAVAPSAVLVLWGEKWLPIVLPLQMLCVGAAIRSVVTSIGSVFLCKNRPDLPLKLSLVKLVWTAAAVGGLGYAFGLNGVAAGMVVSLLPSWLSIWLAFRLAGQRQRALWHGLLPPLIGSLLTSAAAFGTSAAVAVAGGAHWQRLALAVPVGMVTYAISMRFLFPSAVREIVQTARTLLGREHDDKRAADNQPPR